MSRQKSMMQNITTVTTVNTAQLGTDVVRIGNNRSGVAFLDVYASGGSGTIVIQTTADDVNGSSTPSAPDPWISVATFNFGAGASSAKNPITDLGESIRWKVTAVTTSVTFRLITYLSDQN